MVSLLPLRRPSLEADATAGGWLRHRLFLLCDRSLGKSATESSINVVWCAELRQEAVLVLL